MCLASSGVSFFSSIFGVSIAASSSLALAAFLVEALGLEAAFFLVEGSTGVFGVDSLSLVLVFGVFAGYNAMSARHLWTT